MIYLYRGDNNYHFNERHIFREALSQGEFVIHLT